MTLKTLTDSQIEKLPTNVFSFPDHVFHAKGIGLAEGFVFNGRRENIRYLFEKIIKSSIFEAFKAVEVEDRGMRTYRVIDEEIVAQIKGFNESNALRRKKEQEFLQEPRPKEEKPAQYIRIVTIENSSPQSGYIGGNKSTLPDEGESTW